VTIGFSGSAVLDGARRENVERGVKRKPLQPEQVNVDSGIEMTIADSVSSSQVTKQAKGDSPKKAARIPYFIPTTVEEGRKMLSKAQSTAQVINRTAGHTQPLICVIPAVAKRSAANIRPPRTSL
jgi:membrane-bound lytic murein transglycosylase B